VAHVSSVRLGVANVLTMAQWNLDNSDLLKIFSMGTCRFTDANF
jgi:hypothetical protein